MSIKDHPKYKRLLRARTLTNVFSLLLSALFLYGVLCMHTEIDLNSDVGLMLTLTPWKGESWWIVIVVLILGAAGPLTLSWKATQQDSMLELFPQCAEEARPIGACTPEELVRMTQDLSQNTGVDVDYIFLDHKKIPNAYTTYVLGRGNIIVLHSNLLEIMPKNEVRAIIAHELGHIHHHDVLWTLSSRTVQCAAGLSILLLGVKYLGVALLSTAFLIFIKRVIAALVFLSLAMLIFRQFHKLEQRRSHQQEFIADAHQAIHVSVEHAISALILLNERSHALSSLMKALRQSDEHINPEMIQLAINLFPSGPVSDAEIQAKALEYYIHAHLRDLCRTLDFSLSEEQELKLVKLLLNHRAKAQNEDSKRNEHNSSEEHIPFVWRHFDWNNDGTLQLEELNALVEALKKDPNGLTDQEGDGHSHPSIRRRVLFLAELSSEQLSSSKTLR